MVPPSSGRIARVPPYSRISCPLPVRGYHPLWPAFPDRSGYLQETTGLLRFRSPLLTESRLMSFPPGTEMFQFPGFASRPYAFRPGYPNRGGFPHSEIRGSTIARISPRLFAACHVLHRLLAPRHPPDALVALEIRRSCAGRNAPCSRRRRGPPDQRRTPLSIASCPPRSSRRTIAANTPHTICTMPKNTTPAEAGRERAHGPTRTIIPPTRGVVEANGIEPMTSCLQSRRSPN